MDFFPAGCLQGLHIGLYEHSAVGRDVFAEVLEQLGADVIRLGHSESFVAVDTEAIRPEDVKKAKNWAAENHLDAIVTTDGDGDRPLISDESGNWLRGDVAGILCARFLNAEAVVTPVSSNTAVEKSGWFESVLRTRIGSPYVIEGMQQVAGSNHSIVVGYEANGGFLTSNRVEMDGRILDPLPTRDAVIVPLAILQMSHKYGKVSRLLTQLPRRYTASDRVKEYSSERSREKIAAFVDASTLDVLRAEFGHIAGNPVYVDLTDGLRVTFEQGEIIHLRPSGNAPELRCYVESDSEGRSSQLLKDSMSVIREWQSNIGNQSGERRHDVIETSI